MPFSEEAVNYVLTIRKELCMKDWISALLKLCVAIALVAMVPILLAFLAITASVSLPVIGLAAVILLPGAIIGLVIGMRQRK